MLVPTGVHAGSCTATCYVKPCNGVKYVGLGMSRPGSGRKLALPG